MRRTAGVSDQEIIAGKVLRELSSHPAVAAVYLFGSRAAQEAGPMSDTDLAVILNPGMESAESDIGCMYSPQIDLVLFHRLPFHIRYQVLSRGRELLVKNGEALFEARPATVRSYLERAAFYSLLEKEALA